MSGVDAFGEVLRGKECRGVRWLSRVIETFVATALAPECDAMRGVGLRGIGGGAFPNLLIRDATPDSFGVVDSSFTDDAGLGGGGGLRCSSAALFAGAVCVGDGGSLRIGTGCTLGLLVTDVAGELPLELLGGGGGGCFFFRSEDDAADRSERGLEGGRSFDMDMARGRGLLLPPSGVRWSFLLSEVDDSDASFSNFERRLLTAGVGVSSTSGGDSVNICETTGDHEICSACWQC